MKISTRARYGLRLMVHLAARTEKGPVFLSEIAKKESISEKYLSLLVIPLKANGLIQSFRGARGGYILGKRSGEIKVKDVVETLEGTLSILECTVNGEACNRSSICVTRDIWSGLSQKVSEYLSSYTLADLVNMSNKKTDNHIDFYQI